MDPSSAIELIRLAIPTAGGTWADLGAGSGTFTRALAQLLGPDGRIFAVDQAPEAIAGLRAWERKQGRTRRRSEAAVIPVEADIGAPLELPGLGGAALDGALVANALHFFADPEPVLANIAAHVRPDGRVVIVEYEGRPSNNWVPHPIGFSRLATLAPGVGLRAPTLVGMRPSTYGGHLYAAVARRA